MKKNCQRLFWCGLALLAFSACQNEDKFTIRGTIEGAADQVLYLENVALKGVVTIDSVRLGDDGAFAFSHEAPEAPDFYVLRIDNQAINLSIDSTETVTVKAQYPGMASDYEVEGSANCQKIKELALKQQELTRRVMQLERNYGLSQTLRQDSLQRMIDTYKQEVANGYIYADPRSAAAYFALFQTLGGWFIFNPQGTGVDKKAFAGVATTWHTFYPESERARQLYSLTEKGIRDRAIIEARQARQLSSDVVVESGVLELDLTDNRGRQQLLTSLRGKVVLLDFHAFALKDSPQRILMLRELYNKYHDRGLEIYQVSLDGDEHFWKQQTRELPWISVRDESGQSAVMYNVSTVPEYFLVDRENQLYKRSIQIKDLEKEIEDLLNRSFRAD